MPDEPNHGRIPSIGPSRIWGLFQGDVVKTVAISVIFYSVLLVLLVLTDLTEPTPALVFVALVPFIVHLVSSGRIDELHFGNLSMKFQEAAKGGISPDLPGEPFEVDEDEAAGKQGQARLEQMIQEQRSSLAFRIGSWYDADFILWYLRRNLAENPHFRYVLFTEQDGRFAGIMNADEFVTYVWVHDADDGDHPGTAGSGDDIEAAIRDGDILDAASVITTRIQEGSTLGEARRKMKDTDSDILAVVDSDEEFVGVLTSENVTSQVLGRLMGEQEN